MPLPLPNLDDRRFEDLVEEARNLIPGLASDWTNHNPTDPGITLIELIAWLTEQLLYRIDRVPESHQFKFLKLLNGPDWVPLGDLTQDISDSVVRLHKRYRAVTCNDYEVLAKEASVDIARTKCIPDRYLGSRIEAERQRARPGHMSIVVIPENHEQSAEQNAALNTKVWEFLDPRRVLTTRHHVVSPIYVPLGLIVVIAGKSDVPAAGLRDNIISNLESRFHPTKGGTDNNGWPFGRNIYVSELFELLENINGVDFVPEIELIDVCGPEETDCVAPVPIWNPDGDLVGLALESYHLPQLRIDGGNIVVGYAFIPVSVTVQASIKTAATAQMARQKVNIAIKSLFSPFSDGPANNWQTENWRVSRTMIESAVRSLTEIDGEADVNVALSGPTGSIEQDETGETIAFNFLATQLADLKMIAALS